MATDWASSGTDPLVLNRHYASQSSSLATHAQSRLGNAWRTSFDAAAAWSGELSSARLIHIVLPSSEEVSFALSGGTWKRVLPRSAGRGDIVWDRVQTDNGTRVSVGADAITLRFHEGTSYEFNAKGQLSQIRSPGGHSQVLTYVGDLNTRVTDNFGRWVEFTYGSGTGGDEQPSTLLTRARTSDGKVIHYRYEDRISAGNPEFRANTSSQDRWVLKSVTYPNGIPQVPGTNLRTVYEYLPSSVRPFLLTGVRDKTGARTAAWTYDRKGRATSSECDLPAYTLKLRGRKKKQSMQFALYMPKPAPVAPEVADKHSFWICDYSVRRNRKTVLKTAYGATWLDALTGAAEGMRRMIPSGEEQDWQTQDGIESWRIFPKLVAANGSYEDHLRMSGELAARERERQEVSEVVPVYSLKLRNKRKRQQLHFTVTMPKAVPRKVWEKSDHPYWKCTVTVEKRGKATAQDFYDDVWTGAIENAFEAMRRMIPEEEECDWETPEGLSGWIVFSKTIPISWGYAFHCKLWKMVVEEERKFVADIERRRLRSEGKQLLGKRR